MRVWDILESIAYTVALLIVAGKVFWTGRLACRLNTVDKRACHLARQYGVFGKILKVAAAKWIAVNIHTCAQQHVAAVITHFPAERLIKSIDQIAIPGRRKRGAAGKQTPYICLSLCPTVRPW